MVGLPLEDVAEVISREMHTSGEGTGGGVSRKLPIDENYVCSLEDGEIGEYVLEEYLAKGWTYVNSLNNGSVDA